MINEVTKLSSDKSMMPDAKGPPATSSLHVVVRLSSSRQFPPGLERISVDPYVIRPIPTGEGEEAILEYTDKWTEEQKAVHPVQEVKLILSWLAVALQSRFGIRAAEINNVPPTPPGQHSQFLGSIEPPSDLSTLFDKICSLDDKLLRTYLRACELYHIAIQVIDDRLSLATFLLVSSVECLGTVVTPGSRFQEAYENFIAKFCPKQLMSGVPDATREKLLRKLYDYRSQYAHGGKDIPIASLLASSRGLVWVKHYENGKEELAPSIDWFASVVRASLLTFLRQVAGEPPEKKRQKLIDLALSYGVAHFKAKRPIQQGQAVTAEDVELQ